MENVQPIMAQEIMQETVQSLWEKHEIIKGQLKTETDTFKEALSEVGEYVELTEKMKDLRDQRKEVVEKLEDENPTLAARIEDLKERLKVAKESLDLKVLDELKRGKNVEVIDNLKRKELKPVISVRFSNQPSLFD